MLPTENKTSCWNPTEMATGFELVWNVSQVFASGLKLVECAAKVDKYIPTYTKYVGHSYKN